MQDATQKSVRKIIRYNNSEDTDFLAYAPVGENGAEEQIVFNRQQIGYMKPASDGAETIIHLLCGVKIQVRMALQDLREKLKEVPVRDDGIIDLSDATKEPENTLKPGKKMPDGTIYLGVYKPKDRDGKSLAKTFNVFAASEDLPETRTYVDTVKHIAKLKNWNGYDGTNYATDKELYAAIKSGSYNGGWIIPTRDILHGKDVGGKETTPDNLYAHKDKGALKGTFKTAASSGFDCPDWYWSSTEDRGNPSVVHNVRFSDGNEHWKRKDVYRLSCRPVRLVPAAG